MLTSSLKSLVLSASIAVLVTFTNAAPAPPAPAPGPPPVSHLDPCGILGAKKPSQITYRDVANCYRAVPLNNDYAAATFSTVHTLFNEFYIFKDSAMIADL